MFLASGSTVIADGGTYPDAPETISALVSIGGTALAALVGDRGVLALVARPDDASWKIVPLTAQNQPLTGECLVPVGPAALRVAIGCSTDSTGDEAPNRVVSPRKLVASVFRRALSHIVLMDCAFPQAEVFAIPPTPSPVVGLVPLGVVASLALVLLDGRVVRWTPLRPMAVEMDFAPMVQRARWLWYDQAQPSAATKALEGIGLVRPTPETSEAEEVHFVLSAEGELLETTPVADLPGEMCSVTAALDVAGDEKANPVPSICGFTVPANAVSKGSPKGIILSPRAADFFACRRSLEPHPGEAPPPSVHERTGPACAFVPLESKGMAAPTWTTGAVRVPEKELPEECPVCFDELPLFSEEVVVLDCGHATHRDCLRECLARAEAYLSKGHRITFNLARCAHGCGRLVRHPCFSGSARVQARLEAVLADVTERAKIDYPGHAADEVMDGYLHYVCGTCGTPYWGGNKDCAAMMSGEPDVDPTHLECQACLHRAHACSTHGTDYLVHKCTYCCNPATDFSLGRLWLCHTCIAEKRREPLWEADSERHCVGNECPFNGTHHRSSRVPVGCLACWSKMDPLPIVQERIRQPPAEQA